eukprot:m.362684 g.362684  ORF g.362684 m.362684 type:complete len:70 (-) comp16651_c1_seq2:1485-1694(-)
MFWNLTRCMAYYAERLNWQSKITRPALGAMSKDDGSAICAQFPNALWLYSSCRFGLFGFLEVETGYHVH